ncbi:MULTISPECIES: cadmium resistance transporter [unclassified Tolypothrix]|uniref:cadmium resistance transporter n=1 Tax=unclassified Tolypothrix TaxID=2649714 RepID=UPI0005EAA503|nr:MULTISPECIES: cadmium resistance transporter [unclassified Tolypothrix]BAY90268.1 cadmium resistance transporter [Microchaete diplosiphon NIES-3275]EKE98897.1 cadmium resistance transporter family protein [Tolypothrix sp. PCC 7601]MBE9083374.1 cadmium resistance transporter [Tolypothrix sp. LEGE 11397]UYD24459.1 cadmium resistance transporter [Tolypothrix sp. PCC 7712]UYD33309.1 cadmium resistance transporter [Tolypothrix sp. PCC 7601]
MSQLGTAFTEGIIAFAATNIDDILILLLFFSQIDSNFRRRHIFIGQYFGFAAIILASLPGFFGGLVVPREWIGLLGILPIAIGIKHLLEREEDTTEVQTVSHDFTQTSPHNRILAVIWSILHPYTYKVAAVTIANGGDNISIYIPLFAGQSLSSLGVILIVFFVMVAIWCAIAYFLSRHPTIAYILSRYGKHIVPFVLIGLGVFIMYERGTFSLLPWFK